MTIDQLASVWGGGGLRYSIIIGMDDFFLAFFPSSHTLENRSEEGKIDNEMI